MMSKQRMKFIYWTDGGESRCAQRQTFSMDVSGIELDEVLDSFAHFLKGVGFGLDGKKLEVVEDD